MSTSTKLRGPIAWMADNSVAANLMMWFVLLGGFLGVLRIKQEVFPSFTLDIVSIQVPYPGASPAEVEQGIVLAVEESVAGIDGVKRVTSTSGEGLGGVSVELLIDADPDKVLSDVKTAVDGILTFPEDAERPSVRLVSARQRVIDLVLAGDQPLASLQGLAEQARNDLIAHPDITVVDVDGIPPLELAVEIPRERLEAYGLTLQQVAQQIGAASLELPGGELETDQAEVLLRVADRRLTAEEFADIVVRGTATGSAVRLSDLGTVIDGYADNDQATYLDGHRAVRLTAYRVGDETPMRVAQAVRDYAEELEARLPDTVSVLTWDDDSVLLEGRIKLLRDNALVGLVLVVLVLTLFLDLRLSLWVALGIPISFMGAFLLMPGLDITVNMISLFALIVTLGMVVDDAIIVGENAYEKMESGMDRMTAAVTGAREMAVPVTFAILTTVAAFAPMFFVPGVSGKIFRILPAVVIAVLLFSLLESFFILPAHLGHGSGRPKGKLLTLLDRPRQVVSRGLDAFIANLYQPMLARVIEYRAISIAVGIAGLIFAFGLRASGYLPFNFFPSLEGDVVTAQVRMPYGTPVERTEEVRALLEASAAEAVQASGGPDILLGLLTEVGKGPTAQGPRGGVAALGSHLLTIKLNLVAAEDRDVTAADVAAAWQAATPEIPGLEVLLIDANVGPAAGSPVDVQLSHPDTEVLGAAAAETTALLRTFTQLTNVENGYAAGKPQLDYTLTDHARTLGITGQDVARQLRASFYGAEALREQRGRNELKVMVRLPEDQRASEYDLEALRVRTPAGGHVPLSYVADVTRGQAPTTITREEGRRTINVRAELAPGVKGPGEVLQALQGGEFETLRTRYPGLEVDLAGQQREQADTFANLGPNYLLALVVIYTLLAIPFRSYIQPLVVMSAIPFGIVGAFLGHVVMGYALSIISMFGIIALSGVVVNDSLVLIDTSNRYRESGMSPQEAIIAAASRRMRPILLTSLTTFFGLVPMIAETSIQAQFLIPMAISLGFGILFATVIILVLLPALYMFFEDVAWAFGVLAARLRPPPQAVLPVPDRSP